MGRGNSREGGGSPSPRAEERPGAWTFQTIFCLFSPKILSFFKLLSFVGCGRREGVRLRGEPGSRGRGRCAAAGGWQPTARARADGSTVTRSGTSASSTAVALRGARTTSSPTPRRAPAPPAPLRPPCRSRDGSVTPWSRLRLITWLSTHYPLHAGGHVCLAPLRDRCLCGRATCCEGRQGTAPPPPPPSPPATRAGAATFGSA